MSRQQNAISNKTIDYRKITKYEIKFVCVQQRKYNAIRKYRSKLFHLFATEDLSGVLGLAPRHSKRHVSNIIYLKRYIYKYKEIKYLYMNVYSHVSIYRNKERERERDIYIYISKVFIYGIHILGQSFLHRFQILCWNQGKSSLQQIRRGNQ